MSLRSHWKDVQQGWVSLKSREDVDSGKAAQFADQFVMVKTNEPHYDPYHPHNHPDFRGAMSMFTKIDGKDIYFAYVLGSDGADKGGHKCSYFVLRGE